MKRQEEKFIVILQKRADWLEARCALAQVRGKHLSFDEAELAALKWAISRLDRQRDRIPNRAINGLAEVRGVEKLVPCAEK